MTASQSSHAHREQTVLNELEASFPHFAGNHAWKKVPDGQDPPDFLGYDLRRVTGLELREWLSGAQMTPAKGRESQRDHIRRVLCRDLKSGYKPRNFASVVISPKSGVRISKADEAPAVA